MAKLIRGSMLVAVAAAVAGLVVHPSSPRTAALEDGDLASMRGGIDASGYDYCSFYKDCKSESIDCPEYMPDPKNPKKIGEACGVWTRTFDVYGCGFIPDDEVCTMDKPTEADAACNAIYDCELDRDNEGNVKCMPTVRIVFTRWVVTSGSIECVTKSAVLEEPN